MPQKTIREESQTMRLPTDAQHRCLHQQLKVAIKSDDKRKHRTFEDVEPLASNLYREDSHSDRLAQHYMDFYDELKESNLGSHCHCASYIDHVRSEMTYGEYPARFTVKADIVRRLQSGWPKSEGQGHVQYRVRDIARTAPQEASVEA